MDEYTGRSVGIDDMERIKRYIEVSRDITKLRNTTNEKGGNETPETGSENFIG